MEEKRSVDGPCREPCQPKIFAYLNNNEQPLFEGVNQ